MNDKDDYKIYLCGITANCYDDIDDLTKNIYNYFDGLCWVVDSRSTDGTKELLESRMGCGNVISAPFYRHHSHQMNNFMLSNSIPIGSWVFLRDSKERFNLNFAKNIRNFCDKLNESKVQTVFSHGKGFAFKYYDDMFFYGNPHWGLQNFRMNVIDLKNYFEKEEDYAYRIWDGQDNKFSRPVGFKIAHLMKYYLYPISNMLAMYYSDEEFRNMEANRVVFRLHIYNNYGSDFSIENFEQILLNEKWKNDQVFIDLAEKSIFIKNFYRYKVLGHDFYDIEKTENEWSLIEYLKHE